MNQQQLHDLFDQLRVRHGICLRVLEAFPEDALDRRLVAAMRTPKEIAVHVYAALRALTEGVHAGALPDFEPDEPRIAAGITSREALLAHCRREWEAAAQHVAAIGDRELQAPVTTPWGAPMPGARLCAAAYDEFLHHRGQLYVMLRVAGVAPPDAWDFKGNAPEYQPTPQSQPA